MIYDHYKDLQAQKPCPYRSDEIKIIKNNRESGCCHGDQVVERRFFCKLFKKEFVANYSSPCWTCSSNK